MAVCAGEHPWAREGRVDLLLRAPQLLQLLFHTLLQRLFTLETLLGVAELSCGI